MEYSNKLKKRIKEKAKILARKHNNISGIEKESAFVFANVEMNFNNKSYDSIQTNDNWKKRLEKRHSHFDDDTLEMQSSNSSDALLMNIFCYPKFRIWTGPSKLLGFDPNNEIEFGWNPQFINEHSGHKTEIDLKIGNIIFEAKLTESSFTTKNINKIRKYPDFKEIFDERNLIINDKNEVENYQLIRNILTAYKYNYRFLLLVDETRIDLIRSFAKTVFAIKVTELRKKMNFITWQELVNSCGKELKEYITIKYF